MGLVSVAIYAQLGLTTRYLRFLLPAQMALALWLGRGAWRLWAWNIRSRHTIIRSLPKLAALSAIGSLLLSLWSGLATLYHSQDFQRDDIRSLVARIEDDLHEGDAILASAPGLKEVLSYYYKGAAPVYGLPASADDEATRSQTRDIIGSHTRLHVLFYGAAEQDPKLIVESTLNSAAFEASDSWVG